jgi:hypothetical protein
MLRWPRLYESCSAIEGEEEVFLDGNSEILPSENL